jgi:hypothetical protein
MADSKFLDPTNIGPAVDSLFGRELRAENDVNGNAIYVGYAHHNAPTDAAVWLIKKNTYDANNSVTRQQIAGGSLSYSFVWDDRSSYFA